MKSAYVGAARIFFTCSLILLKDPIRHNSCKSEPENPSVCSLSWLKLISDVLSFSKMSLRIAILWTLFWKIKQICLEHLYKHIRKTSLILCIFHFKKMLTGRGILKVAGILLKIALSKSWGLLVAPIIITVLSGSVKSPSHKNINCAFIMAVASWSWDVLDLSSESMNSNKNIIMKKKKNYFQ